jgi:hypothetical protein
MSLRIAAAAFAATAVGFASPASAGLVAEYSANGGGLFANICSAGQGGSCSPSNPFTTSNGLVFTIYGATSNSPGTPVNSDVLQATVQLTNPTTSDESIILRVGDTGFLAPAGNVMLANNISGTVVTGGATNLFSSIACADPGDGQNNCAGAFQTPLAVADITAPGSGASSNTVAIPDLLSPYSLTEVINLTLAPGANINFSASADVVPAPEPMGLAVLAVGLLGLGMTRVRFSR